jgi:hypothetical protein
MGTTQATLAGMRWGATGRNMTVKGSRVITGSMFCACPEVHSCAFFLTIVVVQNVSLPMTDRATGSNVTPKGVPLGVHMRNRKLRNIHPSGAFLSEVTL